MQELIAYYNLFWTHNQEQKHTVQNIVIWQSTPKSNRKNPLLSLHSFLARNPKLNMHEHAKAGSWSLDLPTKVQILCTVLTIHERERSLNPASTKTMLLWVQHNVDELHQWAPTTIKIQVWANKLHFSRSWASNGRHSWQGRLETQSKSLRTSQTSLAQNILPNRYEHYAVCALCLSYRDFRPAVSTYPQKSSTIAACVDPYIHICMYTHIVCKFYLFWQVTPQPSGTNPRPAWASAHSWPKRQTKTCKRLNLVTQSPRQEPTGSLNPIYWPSYLNSTISNKTGRIKSCGDKEQLCVSWTSAAVGVRGMRHRHSWQGRLATQSNSLCTSH